MKNIVIIGLLLCVAVCAFGFFTYFTTSGAAAPTPVSSTPRAAEPIDVTYLCANDQTIHALFTPGVASITGSTTPPVPGGTVTLELSTGQTDTLTQTISADGGRYANTDGSFVFWSKGDSALVLEQGKPSTRFTGCVSVAPAAGGVTGVHYADSIPATIRYPADWVVSTDYQDPTSSQARPAQGVQFRVGSTYATGTNLAADSGVALVSVAAASTCDAAVFFDTPVTVSTTSVSGTEYSTASTTDAGVGNRYQKVVYAFPYSSPCVAVEYYVHSSVLENYPVGTVRAYDESALRHTFDIILDSVRLGQ